MSRGKCASCRPSATSFAAATIACASFGSRSPSSAFASATLRFTRAIDSMNTRGNRKPLIGKLSTARWVCGPQSASAGTRTSPIVSFSTRNSVIRSHAGEPLKRCRPYSNGPPAGNGPAGSASPGRRPSLPEVPDLREELLDFAFRLLNPTEVPGPVGRVPVGVLFGFAEVVAVCRLDRHQPLDLQVEFLSDAQGAPPVTGEGSPCPRGSRRGRARRCGPSNGRRG